MHEVIVKHLNTTNWSLVEFHVPEVKFYWFPYFYLYSKKQFYLSSTGNPDFMLGSSCVSYNMNKNKARSIWKKLIKNGFEYITSQKAIEFVTIVKTK